MQPYDLNTIKLLLIGVVSFLPAYFIPATGILFLDLAIKSSIIGGLFILLILKMEAAPDINAKIRKNLLRFHIKL